MQSVVVRRALVFVTVQYQFEETGNGRQRSVAAGKDRKWSFKVRGERRLQVAVMSQW